MKYLLNEYHSNDGLYIITNYQKTSRSGVYIFKLRAINIVNRRVGEIERCGIYALLEHFQEKWNPVFRPKVRAKKAGSRACISAIRVSKLLMKFADVEKHHFSLAFRRPIFDPVIGAAPFLDMTTLMLAPAPKGFGNPQ